MCHAGQSELGPAEESAAPPVGLWRAYAPARGTSLERIQQAVLGRRDLAPSECVRRAVLTHDELAARGVPSAVAVGRIHNDGSQFDHAWTLQSRNGAWRPLDACGGAADEVMALVTTDGVWARASDEELASLRPSFFLTIHCEINDAALKTVLDPSLVDDINHVNARVDDPFAHPNYDPREHFDNSLIEEGIALIDDRLSWQGDTRLHTVTTGAPDAIAYGLGCHAVADFYSHTNYAPMALAHYQDAKVVPTLDKAIDDLAFLKFVATKWHNRSMWQNRQGYSTTQVFPFDASFDKCLFSGAYAADQWTGRPGTPHHNDVAVDQSDSALVHAPPIQRRHHPFAFPGSWKPQYALRRRLAIAHLKDAMKRARTHDPNPFLGSGKVLPDILKPPPWNLANNTLARAAAILVRGGDGRPA